MESRSTARALEAEVDALETGNRGLELRKGGDFFGSGAEIYAAKRGLVAGCCPGLKSPRLGELRDECGFEVVTGLRVFCAGFGIAVGPFLLGMLYPGFRPSAELFLVEGDELPESELRLRRRELTGIRDCESRLYVRVDVGDNGRGRGWTMVEGGIVNLVGEGGPRGAPVKSLLVRRCIDGGRSGSVFSVLISSNVGVTPRYHAEGDDGETLRVLRSLENIGFGLCMLPSEPRRRRGPGIP